MLTRGAKAYNSSSSR